MVVVHLLVFTAVAHNVWRSILPLLYGVPQVNSLQYHQAIAHRIAEGGGLSDVWIPYWGSGFAVPRYVPPFPHLLAAWLCGLLRCEVAVVVELLHILALGLLPLWLFLCCRRAGLSDVAASAASFCSILVSPAAALKHVAGLQIQRFLWEGDGDFALAVSLVFVCFGWATAQNWIENGEGFFAACALVGCCWMCHLEMGYGLMLVLLVVSGWNLEKFLRWMAMCFLVGLQNLYVQWPRWTEQHLFNSPKFEEPEFWNSYGLTRTWTLLFQGKLLDGSVFPPLLTLLFMASLLLFLLKMALGTNKGPLNCVFWSCLVSFVLSSGSMGYFLPSNQKFIAFHRFFALFHLFALMQIGWLIGEIAGVVL